MSRRREDMTGVLPFANDSISHRLQDSVDSLMMAQPGHIPSTGPALHALRLPLRGGGRRREAGGQSPRDTTTAQRGEQFRAVDLEQRLRMEEQNARSKGLQFVQSTMTSQTFVATIHPSRLEAAPAHSDGSGASRWVWSLRHRWPTRAKPQRIGAEHVGKKTPQPKFYCVTVFSITPIGLELISCGCRPVAVEPPQ